MKKKISIIGSGESGTGAALLAKKQGYEVFVSDFGEIKDEFKAILEENHIAYEEKKHSEDLILDSQEIIKSPGVPLEVNIIRKALSLSIPVIDEIEFASRFTKAKIIGITGTNGKTTTTKLIYHLLKEAGFDVAIGGNYGISFAKLLLERDYNYFVLELSSFQLDTCHKFRPDIGIITNVTPDHLDRYSYDIDKYAAAKYRIAQAMTKDDALLLCGDSPTLMKNVNLVKKDTQTFIYALDDKNNVSAYQSGDFAMINYQNKPHKISLKNAAIEGPHNVQNMLSAAFAGVILGIFENVISESFASFVPEPHRMQEAGIVNGIRFVNDSKATNIAAAIPAIQSFKEPIILILGGRDKGNDYQELIPYMANVKAIVCLGEINNKIISFFENKIEIWGEFKSKNLDSLIEICLAKGKNGDVVLLSPCCASFDIFKNYEERGNLFMKAIKNQNTVKQ